jgi:hypothetical protein
LVLVYLSFSTRSSVTSRYRSTVSGGAFNTGPGERNGRQAAAARDATRRVSNTATRAVEVRSCQLQRLVGPAARLSASRSTDIYVAEMRALISLTDITCAVESARITSVA